MRTRTRIKVMVKNGRKVYQAQRRVLFIWVDYLLEHHTEEEAMQFIDKELASENPIYYLYYPEHYPEN